MSMGTCWPWETAATLLSAQQHKALRHPWGRRGAGAYHGGRPPIACLRSKWYGILDAVRPACLLTPHTQSLPRCSGTTATTAIYRCVCEASVRGCQQSIMVPASGAYWCPLPHRSSVSVRELRGHTNLSLSPPTPFCPCKKIFFLSLLVHVNPHLMNSLRVINNLWISKLVHYFTLLWKWDSEKVADSFSLPLDARKIAALV